MEVIKMSAALTPVTSPVSGVFYRKPAPDQPPFVEVGSTVKKGQTLCLLETMKVFTKIKSHMDGIVEEILPQDEDIIEKGQVILHLKPKG
jgi:acetyl-CoA carboxylase biotin carboxyl carrier protein